MDKLNADQRRAVLICNLGHNLLILSKVGMGKTYTIQ